METTKKNLLEFIGRLTSRKFLGTVAIILITILNRTQNWGLNDTEVGLMTAAIVTYIIANVVDERING
jgi:uncharacterized membrane protein YhaH (DUF805 family)